MVFKRWYLIALVMIWVLVWSPVAALSGSTDWNVKAAAMYWQPYQVTLKSLYPARISKSIAVRAEVYLSKSKQLLINLEKMALSLENEMNAALKQNDRVRFDALVTQARQWRNRGVKIGSAAIAETLTNVYGLKQGWSSRQRSQASQQAFKLFDAWAEATLVRVEALEKSFARLAAWNFDSGLGLDLSPPTTPPSTVMSYGKLPALKLSDTPGEALTNLFRQLQGSLSAKFFELRHAAKACNTLKVREVAEAISLLLTSLEQRVAQTYTTFKTKTATWPAAEKKAEEALFAGLRKQLDGWKQQRDSISRKMASECSKQESRSDKR